ncbi:MAG: TIGR03564 family F420-dependent LLM class oxidoreductase [Actinomyces sp.]|nr:MAG: TIGR03564 family F420-dependent LLM class oxidoreductase [Actinomyces sp.]
MRISINGSTQLIEPDIDTLVAHAAGAAADGLAGWWLAQTGLVDALTVLAVAAERAPGIELGTAVVPTFPVHPTALAAKALTTQAVTGGRLALGIGVNHAPVVEQVWGRRFERPIRHVLDYLDGLQALLTEGRADHAGEIFTTRFEAPRPTDDPPSVLLAALGPQMLRIAGRRTDGTVLWMTGPRTIADHIAPTLRAAAEAAGRPEPRIVCSLPIAVTDDEKAVREFVDVVLARYGELPSYRAVLDREGVRGPGDVMVCGDEDAVREQLAAIAAAGATEFAAAEIGRDDEELARTRALLAAVAADA